MALFLGAQGLTGRQLGPANALSMIDYFALALTHGLIALTLWRLLQRSELDAEPGAAKESESAGDA
jgi:hypothetical protein